ncbi:MAG: hypothetical protein AB9834_20025 [Lentimicrobium sp.]
MKKKKIEFDVDEIGGQGPLTIEEEKALAEFFKQRRLSNKKPIPERKSRTIKRNKTTV